MEVKNAMSHAFCVRGGCVFCPKEGTAMKRNIKNRCAGLLLALVVAASLVACKGNEESSSLSESESLASESVQASQSEPAQEEASVEVSSPEVSAQNTEEDAASGTEASMAEELPKEEVYLGLFTHSNEMRFSTERAPWLEIGEGGVATFRFNSGIELGTIQGRCTLSGPTLTLWIKEVEMETATETVPEFQGSETPALFFTVVGKDTLLFTGVAYGLTKKGDEFTLEGMPGGFRKLKAPST